MPLLHAINGETCPPGEAAGVEDVLPGHLGSAVAR